MFVLWTNVALELEGLTPSCMGISMTRVAWMHGTFQNNFWNEHTFSEYMRKSCWLSTHQHFVLKNIPLNALGIPDITKVIGTKLGATGIDGLKSGFRVVAVYLCWYLTCFL